MTKARTLANNALTAISTTELGFLDGVTSAIQTQIDSKIGQATAINPTIVDAKGDIIAATAADTVSKLSVGANDTVLTADSSTATGLKWAAAGGALSLAQIATGNANSGTSVTISSLSTYDTLILQFKGLNFTVADYLYFRINGGTSGYYYVAPYFANGDFGSIRGDNTGEVQISGNRDHTAISTLNHFTLVLTNCKSTTGFTNFQFSNGWTNPSYGAMGAYGTGIYAIAAAVSSITLYTANGVSFTGSGTYRIWGA